MFPKNFENFNVFTGRSLRGNYFMGLRETHNTLQLPSFLFLFFCRLFPEYQSQQHPEFCQILSYRKKADLL